MLEEKNVLTHPYVRKEELDQMKVLYEEQRKKNDELHARLEEMGYILNDGVLNINKMIEAVVGEKKIDPDKLRKIKEQIKEIADIERVSQLISNNILLQKDVKSKQKQVNDLTLEKTQLRARVQRMESEILEGEDRDRKAIANLRNLDESIKEKLKALADTEAKLADAEKRLATAVQLRSEALEQAKQVLAADASPASLRQIAYKPTREERMFLKCARTIERRLNKRHFIVSNRIRAAQEYPKLGLLLGLIPQDKREPHQAKMNELGEKLGITKGVQYAY